MSWIKIEKHCADTGDTRDAVQKKLRRGVWLHGVHVKLAPDGRLWVNKDEVNKWVEQGLVASLPKMRRVA